MDSTFDKQLDQFVAAFVSYHQEGERNLLISYDPKWPSPCYQGEANNDGSVAWMPVRQASPATFSNVEEALGIRLNAEFCAFFSRYYSDNLSAMAPQGQCELLQVFNSDDLVRLQQNLIGHLLMKKRLKQEPTLFFALTDEEDYVLSVLNRTGEVVLEQVGRPPKDVVAESLGAFISSLSPR
ncbi:SecY-interacting protein [Alteromonas sp. 345S023]|uniref:SecY-interacting protein n=2 Tax=Alteromonas profundi TaxID=2696062 RepID=A0A7X5LJA6_9ALTE|nr:SecY-interacting protein [Alteromonas profundi]